MRTNASSNAVISLPQAMAHSSDILIAAQKLASAVYKVRKKRLDEEQARKLAERLRHEVREALKALPEGDYSGHLYIEKTIQRELIKANNDIDRAIEGANKEAKKSEQAYADLIAVLLNNHDSQAD
ncbi:hypothetical protein QC823_02330 [Halomonas vilamensis]|uniref:Uncharacterized protein n=1 Tax=Vreelandella vilamensis TaxID=531309 RepID=A0ABU1H148_9GAMM|nr:hypothetical protein [Halomonas vilamensis]MDR5897835.1 hypothetical protein [Halomonas vilamensis]